MFCKNCGIKCTKIDNKGNEKKFLLSNLFIFFLFIVIMILEFSGIMISLFRSTAGESFNGLVVIVGPIVGALFSIPQFIGIVLSGINMKVKKYTMLIFIFIVSLISLFTIIHSSKPSITNNNGVLFLMSLTLNITLSVILLIKIILKNIE